MKPTSAFLFVFTCVCSVAGSAFGNETIVRNGMYTEHYDANGNLASTTKRDGMYTESYDRNGKLKGTLKRNGQQTKYYDSNGYLLGTTKRKKIVPQLNEDVPLSPIKKTSRGCILC